MSSRRHSTSRNRQPVMLADLVEHRHRLRIGGGQRQRVLHLEQGQHFQPLGGLAGEQGDRCGLVEAGAQRRCTACRAARSAPSAHPLREPVPCRSGCGRRACRCRSAVCTTSASCSALSEPRSSRISPSRWPLRRAPVCDGAGIGRRLDQPELLDHAGGDEDVLHQRLQVDQLEAAAESATAWPASRAGSRSPGR